MASTIRAGRAEQMKRDVESSQNPRQPKLVFRSGTARGQVFGVIEKELKIGRDVGNDIVLSDDVVSSAHAKIVRRDDDSGFDLCDGGSKNGTFVNGERIEGTVDLTEGDLVRLAKSGPEIQFTFEEPVFPSLFSTCTATLTKSGSRAAVREFFSSRKREGVVSASGVVELLDNRFAEIQARSKRITRNVSILAALVLMAAVGIAVWVHGRGNETTGPAVHEAGLLAIDLEIDSIYGGLFHSYRTEPLGSVGVLNRSDETLENLELRFDLWVLRKGKTDRENLLRETFVRVLEPLAPGAKAQLQLAPKLSSSILSPLDQEVTSQVTIRRAGEAVVEVDRAVEIYGQNVMDWSDPSRIAAFVDTEDLAVRAFVNQALKSVDGNSVGFPGPQLVKALSVLSALGELELRYLEDGNSPARFAQDGGNDRIKYPGETLLDGTGDCDDLSVLAAANLEAVEVSTAFLVAPDHVLIMFDTGMDHTLVEETPFESDEVIVWEGRIWIPVEATQFGQKGGDFFSAWQAGSKRKAAAESNELKIIATKDAWTKFRPFRPEPDPDLARRLRRNWVTEAAVETIGEVLKELEKLQRGALHGRAEELREDYEGLELAQSLGLLYAHSGLHQDAIGFLAAAILPGLAPIDSKKVDALEGEPDDDVRVLLGDLGSIVSLSAEKDEDYDLAVSLYRRALRGLSEDAPEAADFMLRVALVLRLKGDVLESRQWRYRAFEVDPNLRETYHEATRSGGTVAGEGRSIIDFLRRGMGQSRVRLR